MCSGEEKKTQFNQLPFLKQTLLIITRFFYDSFRNFKVDVISFPPPFFFNKLNVQDTSLLKKYPTAAE